MRYSVYDYTRRAYDYYEAPGPSGTHAGSPPLVRAMGGLGASPESAVWRLPVGARKVGSGEFPQGMIASLSGAAGGLDPVRVGTIAAIAYLVWRTIR